VFGSFWVILAFQVLGGLGLAMQSGGIEALVHDSLPDDEHKDALYSRVHGHKMAILFTSRVVTVLLGGVLFSIDPKLPFGGAVVVYVVGLVVSLFFQEVRVETPTLHSSVAHIKQTFSIMASKSTLVWFLALAALYSFCSEAMFALYQPYFKSLHIDIGQFGIFYATQSLFSAVGALSITRISKKYSVFSVMLLLMLAVLTTLAVMVLRIPGLTYLAIVPSAVAFGCIMTLQNVTTQKMVSSRHQATAVSIASFVRTGAFLLSVIVVGVALDLVSVSAVTTLLTAITAVALLPFVISFRRKVGV
jgi:MFS family permease